jgi:predicted RNase H-like HicB family nuclease
MITFKIEKDGEEFHTWSPELPGCHSHGKSVNEAMANLKDAIELYLEVLMEEELTLQTLEMA